MDISVIAAWKQRYLFRFLTKRTELLFIQATLCEDATAKKMKKGEMGLALADGKNARVLDAAELGKSVWEKISQETIAHCWIKADIFPQFCRWMLSIIGVNPLLIPTRILMY